MEDLVARFEQQAEAGQAVSAAEVAALLRQHQQQQPQQQQQQTQLQQRQPRQQRQQRQQQSQWQEPTGMQLTTTPSSSIPTLKGQADVGTIYQAPSGPFPGRGGRSRAPVAGRLQEERQRAAKYAFEPNNLLVLLDGTDQGHAALENALHFRRRNDRIFLLHLVKLAGPEDDPAFAEANANLEARGKQICDHAYSLIAERQIGRYEIDSLAACDIHERALEFADLHNIDCIFMGSRGFAPDTDDFYGDSFAKYVIRHAPCSVMVSR